MYSNKNWSWGMVGVTLGFTGFILLIFAWAGADVSFPEMIDGAEAAVALDVNIRSQSPTDAPTPGPPPAQYPKVPPTRLSTLHPAVPPFDDHDYNYDTTGLPPPLPIK